MVDAEGIRISKTTDSTHTEHAWAYRTAHSDNLVPCFALREVLQSECREPFDASVLRWYHTQSLALSTARANEDTLCIASHRFLDHSTPIHLSLSPVSLDVTPRLFIRRHQ